MLKIVLVFQLILVIFIVGLTLSTTKSLMGNVNRKPTLVIAHYKEDLSWMDDYNLDAFNVQIYRKFYKTPISRKYDCVHLPNLGRESHTYLHYIVTNYHNLPNITLFTMAGLSYNKLKRTKFEYMINNYKDCEKIGYCAYNQTYPFRPRFKLGYYKSNQLIPSTVRPFGEWYKTYINKDLSKIEKTGVNYQATFAVSAKSIKRYPLQFYKDLLLQHTVGDNPEVGHYMERTWRSIFLHQS